MEQIDSMMGEAGRTDIDSTEIKALPSGTSAVESVTVIQSNGETEGVLEVSSPKPRICVALPQSKYPPITRIDLIEQTDFHSLRTFEESPRSEYSPYCEDNNNEQKTASSSTTILIESPPPKPVIESPSTNTIHPLSTITSQNGVPELIQFNILMDSPKSLFSDSESSPSPIIRNDKITSLVIPSISPNPSKLERKDSRESWALYTPSELHMSPLSRAQTTPHSNQHRPQTTPSFSPAGDSRFWGNLSQSNSNYHCKAGSAPITPHNFVHRTSAPVTPTPGGLFFCERKCSLVESVISPATHELKLFQKGIQTSPLESPQTPSSDEKRDSQASLPPTTGDQVSVSKVDNDNHSCIPHLLLPTIGAVSPRFRNSSPCSLVITKEIQPIGLSKQQQLEASPSKSGLVSPKVPLLELGPKEKSLCCCLIS